MKNLLLFMLGVAVAAVLAKTGAVYELVGTAASRAWLASFVAGIFFTSVATVAPAGVALVELGRVFSPWSMALFGGLGAMCGDLLIFTLARRTLKNETDYLLSLSKFRRWRRIFRGPIFQWLVVFIGAVVIASPLPDELGLALMSVSRLRLTQFLPLSFTMNFVGILTLLFLSRNL